MRSHEIEKSIFEIKMSSQKITLFRMRQGFAHQSPIALTRSQVITLNIGSVDLLTVQHGGNDGFVAKDDPAPNFHHASIFTLFVNLSIKKIRGDHPSRNLARTTATALRRKWLRCAVIGYERGHISGQLITSEQRRTPVSPRFEGSQKGGGLFFAPLV